MKSRAVPVLLALLLALGAARAAAQVIPGLPRPQQRPRVQPPREQVRPREGQRAPNDTTPGRPQVQDTLIDRLLRLEGYVPVQYEADSAEYRAEDRTLRLRGGSRVEREGNVMTAEDSIVYMERAELIGAFGNPRGNPQQGEEITGDVFWYDLALRRSTVRGARTKITESATWYVSGNVTDERGQRVYAENSTFTSDDREQPAYHFRADKIMVIRNRILVGRPAYLYFKDVPVMALPFIVQDLERGRRSGFLIPQFEINDIVRTRGGGRNSRGTGREFSNIGYYWAINQYLGLELAGRWRSQTYSALRGNLGFNFRRRFLNGSIGFEEFWETDGGTRLTADGQASWKMNERTDVSGSLRFASSSEFERNRTVDPLRQVSDLSSNGALTRRFDWGSLSLNAERRQSIADDDVTFTPRLSLNVNPINILPSVVLNVSANGSRTTSTPGSAFERRLQGTEQANLGAGLGLTIGNLTISGNAAYTQNSTRALDSIPRELLDPEADTLRLGALPGFGNERIQFSVGTAYQIPLFASTRLSPSVSFSRELARRDTTGTILPGDEEVFGHLVAGPARLNVGASLSTDLYGFFPGFGGYSAIRHHVKPIFTWRYSPAAEERDSARAHVQRRIFGAFSGRTENTLEIGLDQTIEAKVRDPEPVRGPAQARPVGDSASVPGDTANLNTGNQAQPSQPRKVTLLAINTSVLSFSFEDLDSLGTRFRNEEISNSVRTDLLGGLQFTVTHDLFDDRFEGARVVRGRLSPFLTSFNTSFSLGQNSALFRWLGFARQTEEERRPERGQTPDSAGVTPATPPGGANFTGNNQQAGAGAWNLSLNYSLTRARRSVRDTIPGLFDRGNSTLGGTLSFTPTKNWAVSWNTQYSTTTGEFSVHRVNLKRDLYRWQANFDYILAPNGNTSFSFSVHLIDLPDLKADYNERSLGVDRPEGTRTGSSGPVFNWSRPPPALPPPVLPQDTTAKP
ncbi:MAG TPA: putative LPS assembly protein LptD [Longimicrobium sp.]